jgi:hypothetical protein
LSLKAWRSTDAPVRRSKTERGALRQHK